MCWIHTTAPVPDFALAANPQLRGMTPLEIYDAVIEALTAKGIAVILNNHTVKSIWCCGLDQNSRWNVAQSDQQWQSDWLLLVNRYKKNKRVVGAELYNEVRRDLRSDPNWGYGGGPDWYQASMDCAARIQREANPDILILIEGTWMPHLIATLLLILSVVLGQASTGKVFPSRSSPMDAPSSARRRGCRMRCRSRTSSSTLPTSTHTLVATTLAPRLGRLCWMTRSTET